MLTNEEIDGQVKKLIIRLGGRLETEEDVKIAFDFVDTALWRMVYELRYKASLQRLVEHFKLPEDQLK